MATQEEPKRLSVTNEQYKTELLRTTRELRQEGILCDVVLKVEGQNFLAHRSILAASSPYFRGLFTNDMREKAMLEIKLDELPASVMDCLLDYMYTGKVTVTEMNAQPLVAAADYLIIQSLKDLGSDFLNTLLCPTKCFPLRDFAEKYNCESLKCSATSFIVKNFAEACETEAFKNIEYRVCAEIIARDDLSVSREEEVFEAMMTWVRHDVENRRQHFEELFSRIRLCSMSKHYLIHQVEKEQLVNSSFYCTRLVVKALKYFVLHEHGDYPHKARKSLERHVDVVVMCGGNLSRETICYSPDKNQWFPLADMLTSRDEHSIAVHDNVLYTFGSTQSENGQAVEQYNAHTNSWRPVANMPQGRCAASATTCGDHIFIIGGRIPNGGSTKQVLRYDVDINKWFVETPMTSKRAGLCTAACGGLVYAIGGLSDRNEFMRSAEQYNPVKRAWRDIPPMQTARYFASAVNLNGKIFVVGGQSSSGAYLASCEAFDPGTEEWSSLPNISIARQAAGVARLGNRVFLFGGCNNSGSLDSLECYDERKRRWEMVTKMPCKRSWVQCGVLRLAKELLQIH